MTDGKTSSPTTGYRRPPVASRFRKGQSGNPAGRPKGSRNRPRPAPSEQLQAVILEEAYRFIKIDEDGEEVRMPIARAVVRSLIAAATNGDPRAQAAFLKMLSDSEANTSALMPAHDDHRPGEFTFKIIDPAAPKQDDRPGSSSAASDATRRI